MSPPLRAPLQRQHGAAGPTNYKHVVLEEGGSQTQHLCSKPGEHANVWFPFIRSRHPPPHCIVSRGNSHHITQSANLLPRLGSFVFSDRRFWPLVGDGSLMERPKCLFSPRCGGGVDAHPSSRYTSAMVWKQVRYLISPGTGWGPWMRLLATSKGMLTQEEMVPDTRPMANFLRNSRVGSWSKR